MLDQLHSSRAWLSPLALALLWDTWMVAHCSGSGGLLLFAQPLVQQEPRFPLLGWAALVMLLSFLCFLKRRREHSFVLVCITPGAKASSLTRLVNLHLALSLISEANFTMEPSDFRFLDVPLTFPRECPFSVLCDSERWPWG